MCQAGATALLTKCGNRSMVTIVTLITRVIVIVAPVVLIETTNFDP
jgi:hypothetical protein